MTDLQQHQQQPCQPPLQSQPAQPAQEQELAAQPQYQPPEGTQQGELHEARQPFQTSRDAPPALAAQGAPEVGEQPAPPKSVRQLLDEYKAELQAAAETEATKQFGKDLDDLAKEYDGISALVAKYRTAHQKFVDQMKPLARIQHDEVQSWCNDPDEIPEALRTAIRDLRKSYAEHADALASALAAAKRDLDGLRSPLDVAKTAEADAQATFERSKTFETTVNGWFTDLAALHKSAKAALDIWDYRLVFAYFLEVEEVWRWIRSLDESLDGAPAKTPAWLLHKLNRELLALVEAKRGRYLAHAAWLAKDKALTSARTNYKYFVEDGGRRRDFIREAQDIEPAPAPAGAAGAGNGTGAGSNTAANAG